MDNDYHPLPPAEDAEDIGLAAVIAIFAAPFVIGFILGALIF